MLSDRLKLAAWLTLLVIGLGISGYSIIVMTKYLLTAFGSML